MIKAVNRNIDNLKKLEEKERYAVNTYPTGPSEMATDFRVSTEINWSALGIPEDLNWDAILAAFSVNVSENSLIGVRYL